MKTTSQEILTTVGVIREYLSGIETIVQTAKAKHKHPSDVKVKLDCPMRIEPYTLAELVAAVKNALGLIC